MASTTVNMNHAAQEAVPKLVRQTLAERIADELRNLVLLEKLQPGAAIPERETAEALAGELACTEASDSDLRTVSILNDEITRALLASDAAASARLLRLHLQTGVKNIESVMSQSDESTVSNASN